MTEERSVQEIAKEINPQCTCIGEITCRECLAIRYALSTERTARLDSEKELKAANEVIHKMAEVENGWRAKLTEAEKKLDNLSYATTVRACSVCSKGFKNRDMADGVCAFCLQAKLTQAEEDCDRLAVALEDIFEWLEIVSEESDGHYVGLGAKACLLQNKEALRLHNKRKGRV